MLLGGSVSNSPTPIMMNAALKALGLDAEYGASSVSAADLGDVFAKLKESGVSGINVTIPHKTSIVSLVDAMDEVSARIGALNTIKREGRSYNGCNTDVDGITGPLNSKGFSRIRRAAVIGTGGAARAFCEAAHVLGCTELVVLSRNPPRAGSFLSSMRKAFPEVAIEFASNDGHGSWRPELVFNASPAGANGIPLPDLPTWLLESRPIVFDAIYSPVETDLIRRGRQLGCTLVYGHEMLLHQGVKSLQIWTGSTPPLRLMEATLLRSLGVVMN